VQFVRVVLIAWLPLTSRQAEANWGHAWSLYDPSVTPVVGPSAYKLVFMNGLAALMAEQSGVFSREQAMKCGFGASAIKHRLKIGEWFIALPAIYRLACERFGLTPAETLFVDDSARNIEGARAAGFDVHHFTDPAALKPALEARGLL